MAQVFPSFFLKRWLTYFCPKTIENFKSCSVCTKMHVHFNAKRPYRSFFAMQVVRDDLKLISERQLITSIVERHSYTSCNLCLRARNVLFGEGK